MSETLRVGIVVPAFFYVPYWAAQENGFYEGRGLDVELVVYGGIDATTKALKGGEIQVGIGSPEHVIHDVEAGGQLRMIGGNVNRLTHDLIAQPEIKRLEDLRGKVLGVSSLSGGTSSLFIEILERAGLHYPGDYEIVEAGVVPPRHDKLVRREIDAAMQTDPHNYIAEDAGFSNLGPVSQWIPYFQFNSVNARLDWAEAHSDVLISFLAGSIEGSRWVAENRADAVALAQRKMDLETRYAERAWEDHMGGDALPLDLGLNFRSIGVTMDMIRKDRASTFTIAADATPEKYAETSFLRKAQERAGDPRDPRTLGNAQRRLTPFEAVGRGKRPGIVDIALQRSDDVEDQGFVVRVRDRPGEILVLAEPNDRDPRCRQDEQVVVVVAAGGEGARFEARPLSMRAASAIRPPEEAVAAASVEQVANERQVARHLRRDGLRDVALGEERGAVPAPARAHQFAERRGIARRHLHRPVMVARAAIDEDPVLQPRAPGEADAERVRDPPREQAGQRLAGNPRHRLGEHVRRGIPVGIGRAGGEERGRSGAERRAARAVGVALDRRVVALRAVARNHAREVAHGRGRIGGCKLREHVGERLVEGEPAVVDQEAERQAEHGFRDRPQPLRRVRLRSCMYRNAIAEDDELLESVAPEARRVAGDHRVERAGGRHARASAPVTSATREKNARLWGVLIDQLTGTVWNPLKEA